MTATTRKYRAPHTSERVFAVKNLCRLIVLVAARAHETTGESLIRANGQAYTHADRETQARWLRRLAARERGEPPLEARGFNRDQALKAYRTAWPTGKPISADPRPDDLRQLLEDGYFLSCSGNTDDVRDASPLDDWVNDVPHEIGVLPFPTDYGPLVVEPMRPRGAGLIRVSWRDLSRFTNEFADAGGRRLCIAVKAGRDTVAARLARQHAKTVARLRDQRDEALDIVTEQRDKIVRLEAACQADVLLDSLQDWITEHRP